MVTNQRRDPYLHLPWTTITRQTRAERDLWQVNMMQVYMAQEHFTT